MTESTSTSTTRPLLVIGGGPAALIAIGNFRKLDKNTPITLVEPKTYSEIAWVTFRTPFDAALADKTLLPLEPYCEEHKITHIRALVTKLTEEEATLDNGDTLAFGACVVCAGAAAPWQGLGRGPAKLTIADRKKQLQEEGDKLLNAKSVCIVGGGLIGVELAGDLADFAKEKGKDVAVTLVHNGPYLCHLNCSKGCGNMLQKKLQALGVKVILNEKAEKLDNGKVQLTSSGETIDAEQVVMTIGITSVNKSFIDPKYLDDKGWIKVDNTFRVQGSKTLLSVGDACNFLANAANQVMTNKTQIAHNIKQVLEENNGGKPNSLKKGGPMEIVCITTVGRKDGVVQLPLGIYTQYGLPAFKNKTLFVDYFMREANYGNYKK